MVSSLPLGRASLGLSVELGHLGERGREELSRASGSQMAGCNLEKRLEAARGTDHRGEGGMVLPLHTSRVGTDVRLGYEKLHCSDLS